MLSLAVAVRDDPTRTVIATFDASGPTFRTDMFPEYKQTRDSTPSDLSSQFPLFRQFLEAVGIPSLAIPGVEADDIIATIATAWNKEGVDVHILSSDKDLAQLVKPGITLVRPQRQPKPDEMLDEEGVLKKFGVTAAQMIDFQSLVGDSVDNIPGVMGVGPKTAVKLLNQYGTARAAIEAAVEGKIPGKLGERLAGAAEDQPLFQQLVTLKRDVEMDMPSQDGPNVDTTQLEALCAQYRLPTVARTYIQDAVLPPKRSAGASSASNKLFDEPPPSAPHADMIIESTQSPSEVAEWIKRCGPDATIGISSFVLDTGQRLGHTVIAFALATHERLLTVSLFDDDASPQELSLTLDLPHHETNDMLGVLSTCPSIIGHDLKPLLKALLHEGNPMPRVAHDTQIAAYVLHNGEPNSWLSTLAAMQRLPPVPCRRTMFEFATKLPDWRKFGTQAVAEVLASEASGVLTVADSQKISLAADDELRQLYRDLELPLLPVLAEMEAAGVLIDTNGLKELQHLFATREQEIRDDIWKRAGFEFNVNSPQIVAEVLYDKLELKAGSLTATGKRSTSKETLEKLDHPLADQLIDYRRIAKLRSTYADALLAHADPVTHRVHTIFQHTLVSTGRLSSIDPNLQNIPIRDEEGRMVRAQFIPPEGHVLLAADYSQIELRVMAHLADDQRMIDAFLSDADIHAATAAEVFSVPIDDVTSDLRRRAKAINFGLIYGMGTSGLQRQLDISRPTAETFISTYFARYPGVAKYIKEVDSRIENGGFVRSEAGRHIKLGTHGTRRDQIQRQAINAPIQGTAADIIKQGMLDIQRWMSASNLRSRMLLQVHDELVFEVPMAELELMQAAVADKMKNAAKLKVPLIVSLGHGPNWELARD